MHSTATREREVASPETLQQELDVAYALMQKATGIDFAKPALCVGDEHSSKFFSIGSMKDIARYHLVQMLYDEKTNTIFVPSHLLDSPFIHLPNYARDNRVFGFRHECVHALFSQLNPEKDAILNSDGEECAGKKYTLIAFNEGLANYLAIASASFSNDPDLCERAERERQNLVNAFADWTDDRFHMQVMAQVCGKSPDDIPGILCAYFSKNPYMLTCYKYIVGYRFMDMTRPTMSELRGLIADPPISVSELIYPANYRLRRMKAAKK